MNTADASRSFPHSIGKLGRALLWVLPLFFLSGCADDRGKCLKSHEEMEMTLVIVGDNQTQMWIPTWYDVCDMWEYPNGKPKHDAPVTP